MAALGLFLTMLAAALCLRWRRRHKEEGNITEAALAVQRADNPMAAAGSDGEVSTTSRQKGAAVALRVLYQPLRTLVGFGQVLTHLGPVLHLDFPPGVQAVMDALRPFAADLQASHGRWRHSGAA
jgi:hypothetical protein